MAGDDEGWSRADWARWFLDHDEVDEAARVLEPGDELVLGRSDAVDLTAALGRRGLAASYELCRLSVRPLAASPRRPPTRVANAPAASAKRTA